MCRTLMQQAIKEIPGVYCIQFDPTTRSLVWRYDERELPGGVLPSDDLRHRIEHNLRRCEQRGHANPRTCDSCRAQRTGRSRCSRLHHLAEEGVITVLPDESCPGSEGCTKLSTKLERLEVDEAPSRKSGRAVRDRFARRVATLPWEPIAVCVTLIALVTGRILESVRAASATHAVAYGVAYLTGGFFGLRAGIESLKERKIDIDLLMILAAVGAAAIGAPFEGTLLLFLFSLSNVLQDFAMDRTRNAIRSLMTLRPARAEVERDGERLVVPVDSVTVGELFFAKPGDRIPLDGVIVTGEAGMDESLLTGESRPVKKGPDDSVLAGSINTNGSLTVRVTKESADSTIAKIIRLVEDAQSRKAKTERFLDTFEQYYALAVIAVTIAFAVVPTLLWGEAFDTALYRAITVMVASSPCALIISTPASILSAIGAGAKRGVLFKGGVYVERAGAVRVIAFDKTGTLTYGKPVVTDVVSLDAGLDDASVIALAAAVEQHSEHVLAKATVDALRVGAAGERVVLDESVAFRAVAGRGVEATVAGRRIRIGAPSYFDEVAIENRGDADERIERLRGERKTVVAVTQMDGEAKGRYLGIIGFSDSVRRDAAEVVASLKALGISKVVMLTGDNDETARAVAHEAGVDEVYSELTPDAKLAAIEELEERFGPTAMVGDGVNDAPSLARASVGVAMGAGGTDVALETADVVLMADELRKIPYLVELSRKTRRTLIFNLALAMSLIVVMIAGVVLIELPLPLAVIGHEGGTVLVSLNGLRLLFFAGSRSSRR
ncbi:MAG: cadmium-translocating P-type ATPase [Spirochaetales bacterium]|nr:cadmium-translocating P-type ATPase [Spirochaetales bacterium]